MNSENCEVLTFANSLIKIILYNVLGIALNTTIMLSKWKFYCPLTNCQSLMDLISTDKLPNWQRGLLRGKETLGDLELFLPYSPWLSLMPIASENQPGFSIQNCLQTSKSM